MNVRSVNGHVSIIDIHGQVTAAAEKTLMEAYTQACDNSARSIVLNFGGLDYMNSTGIGLLVTLLIRVNRHAPHQRLLTYGLSEHYRQIFQLTRLSDAIAVFDSEAEAVASA
ncbi:MAG: anti-sigma factor antagonist [Chloroflexi bacterium]|nr:anti-sigma factor antagonist [Chloroflexota bacterium]